MSEVRYKNVQGLDWPCTPRPKPLAINDSTHDLPRFDEFSCKYLSNCADCVHQINIHCSFSDEYNIIDWSKRGRIAASFDCDLVLWGPPSTCNPKKSTVVFKLGHIKSLAFNPSGNKLALGVAAIIESRTKNELQILELEAQTAISGRYAFPDKFADEIRTIAWDPSGENIVW